MGLLIAGMEPADLRIGTEAILRIYAGSELLWDYENAAGRATVLPPRLRVSLLARKPGRSVLPILPRRTISVAPRVPVVTARRAVRVAVPKLTASVSPRLPQSVAGKRSTTIYPPKLAVSLAPRLPVITPRRTVSIAVPRRTISVTPRIPVVSILYSVDVAVPRRTVAVIPRVPTVTPRRAASVAVPRLTLQLSARLPVVTPRRARTIAQPRLTIAVTPRVPEVTTSTPLVAAGLNMNQSLSSNGWVVVPASNWYASWTSYPLTVKSGNGFKVVGDGDAQFTLRFHTNSSATNYTRDGRIRVNGVIVATVGQRNTQSVNHTFPDLIPVHDGDVVTVELISNGLTGAQRTFLGGADGQVTRVEMVPVP